MAAFTQQLEILIVKTFSASIVFAAGIVTKTEHLIFEAAEKHPVLRTVAMLLFPQ